MRALWPSVVLLGCYSGVGLGRATTLAPRQTRVAGWVEATASTAQVAGPVTAPWGHFGVSLARGITPRLELGARLSAVGFSGLGSVGAFVDAKYQARRRDGGWSVALMPSLGYHAVVLGGTPWHNAHLQGVALFGRDVGRHQVIVGVRLGVQSLAGTSQETLYFANMGLHLGVSLALSARWHLQPEVLLGWSPVRFSGEDAATDRVGAGMLQLGLGVARSW